jgi:hypothetical protein
MCEIMDAGAAAPEGGLHGRSSAVDVSVVMALLFGHEDGEERVAGILALAVPRQGTGNAQIMSGGLTRRHWAV